MGWPPAGLPAAHAPCSWHDSRFAYGEHEDREVTRLAPRYPAVENKAPDCTQACVDHGLIILQPSED